MEFREDTKLPLLVPTLLKQKECNLQREQKIKVRFNLRNVNAETWLKLINNFKAAFLNIVFIFYRKRWRQRTDVQEDTGKPTSHNFQFIKTVIFERRPFLGGEGGRRQKNPALTCAKKCTVKPLRQP